MDAGNAVDRTYWWTTHHGEDYDEIIVDEAQDVEEARLILTNISETSNYYNRNYLKIEYFALFKKFALI